MTRRITEIHQLRMQAARFRKQRRVKLATVTEARLRDLVTAQMKSENRRVRA